MSTRNFYELRSTNDLGCNLTELLAAESQDRGYVTHNDFAFGHTNRYAYAWKQLTGSLRETKTLLDVGAGKLQLPYFFWRNRYSPVEDFKYWGIELRAKQDWLPDADKHWQVDMNLIRGDILLDDFSTISAWPDQFDVVIAFESFEHVPRNQQQEFVNRLFSWTRPGGTCLFSTPNAGVSKSTAENHLDETGESRERTYDEKIEIVSTAGFKVEDTFGTFCGTTRLPDDVKEKLKSDPDWMKIKKFLSHALLTSVISAPYPKESNNALFHLSKPV